MVVHTVLSGGMLMLDILKDPILGNPLIWGVLLYVVLYVVSEVAGHRQDRAWEKLQEERWARIRHGETLKPLPPHVDQRGAMRFDVASMLRSEHDRSIIADILRPQL